jgi:hypothetical protein
MNVEIGTEAAQFPEKKYINGIFFAVRGNQEEAPHPSAAAVRPVIRTHANKLESTLYDNRLNVAQEHSLATPQPVLIVAADIEEE